LRETGTENQQQSLTPPENAAIIPAVLGVEAEEIKRTRQVVCLQIVVALAIAGVAYSTEGGPQAALAVLSGASVSVANGMLLAWRMSRSSSGSVNEAHPLDAQHQLRRLQFYAAERFLVVAALLGLCLAALKLPQPAVLAGFVTGQAVLMAARVILNKFKTEIVTR
jgi:ATP synthase protein I